MKYAVFTTSTPEWSPEQAARTLAEQGWDGIEWSIKDFPPADPPGFWAGNRAVWPLTGVEDNVSRIAELTKATGLEYSAIGGYALANQHDDVERMLAVTAELGARQVRVNVPHVRTAAYPDLLESVRKDYEWVAERAAHHGVKALVELHHRMLTSSASAAVRLLDGLDPAHVGIIHDVGNLVIEGQEDYLAAFEMMGDYFAHVHVKNAVWKPDPEPEEDGTIRFRHHWATLRTGQASISDYFEALRRFGYDGWVTVEDFSTEVPLAERSAGNLAYLRAVEARVAALPADRLCEDPTDTTRPATRA